jgi:hypothetical protein
LKFIFLIIILNNIIKKINTKEIITDLFELIDDIESFNDYEYISELNVKLQYLIERNKLFEIDMKQINKAICILSIADDYMDTIIKIIKFSNFVFTNDICKFFHNLNNEILSCYNGTYPVEIINYVTNEQKINYTKINFDVYTLKKFIYMYYNENNELVSNVTYYNIKNRNINHAKLVKYILKYDLFDTYKKLVIEGIMEPTSEHLTILCSLHDRTIFRKIKFIVEHKVIPTRDNMMNLCKHNNVSNELIILFLNVGYIPDLWDIKTFLKCGVEIPEFYKYDIQIDNTFLKFCLDNKFYPDYFQKYIFSSSEMREIFLKVNCLNNIEKLIKNKKVKFTRECLANVCQNNNLELAKFLIEECNIRINNHCIQIVLTSDNKEFKKYIFDSAKRDSSKLTSKCLLFPLIANKFNYVHFLIEECHVLPNKNSLKFASLYCDKKMVTYISFFINLH